MGKFWEEGAHRQVLFGEGGDEPVFRKELTG